ncbi:Luc7-like protein 3 [Geodia barretti]|nr:Luc7-like protein 3 [Geodia barretti]
MASAAAALLDELMGRCRNVIPGKEVQEMNWDDSEVCKNYLCGFCPCDLFTNTRADIGTCDKIHDEKLRQKYQESGRVMKTGYEVQFLSELDKLVRSLDRRVAHGKERLHKSAEAKQKQMAGFHEEGGSEKLRQMNLEINSRVMKLEELGRCGEVEGAQVLLKEVEALEKDREKERAGLMRDSSKTLAGFEVDANDFHEKMELCDVCGSFLVIGDSQSRVDAHLLGKQHLGYARIRAAISELKTKLNKMRITEMDNREQTDVIARLDVRCVYEQGEEEVTQQGEEKVTQQGEEEVTQQGEEKVTQQGEEEVTQQGEEKVTQQGEEEVTQQGEGKVTQQGEEKVTQQGEEKVTQQGEEEEEVTRQGEEEVPQQGKDVMQQGEEEKITK